MRRRAFSVCWRLLLTLTFVLPGFSHRVAIAEGEPFPLEFLADEPFLLQADDQRLHVAIPADVKAPADAVCIFPLCWENCPPDQSDCVQVAYPLVMVVS